MTNFYFLLALYRFAYVVVHRTTATSTIPSSTQPIRTDAIISSHIPTISSSNKLIKSKQMLKDEGTTTKRASVRRTTIGRSKLSRSPVKSLTSTISSVTSTNHTITTTTASSQVDNEAAVPVIHERVLLVSEDIIGPVTRSRMCRFCTTEESINETNHKRGKRSLSNSRFYDKKNKLSRKNQISTPIITGTSVTRRLRKEASLDSALVDLGGGGVNDAQDNTSSLSEPPTQVKEESSSGITKTRLKKPTVRSSSQKVFSSN